MKEFIEKFKEIKTIIEENQNIILTAHVNPDGDAVGSGLGLFLTLKENYKDKKILDLFYKIAFPILLNF